MKKDEIIEIINKIISKVEKKEQLLNKVQDIINGKPYIEDGYEVRLIKQRRKINAKNEP